MNIGATKAHKINCSLNGGYAHFRPTKVEYKIFWRDYRNIVGKNDAQCVVDQLTIRKESSENFFFDYKLDKKTLSGLFWADETAKENYSHFSDVISLDATYRTNMYNMIFVPFTAINNHMKSIIVGAALLASETIDSYTWILNCFIRAHGEVPPLILSDEDPALKQAIEKVMPHTHHRLCMWHIMRKIPSKIASDVFDNTDFRSKIHKLVWNANQSTSEFEEQWNLILDEFDLRDHNWLKKMFGIKDKWIPCYFSHIQISGLMKTTSRSKSSNSFFNAFSNRNNLLVNFMFNFDTTISKQRYEQRKLDVASNMTTPNLLSENITLKIELDASDKYTREVFLKVQKEIKKALTKCYQTNVIHSGESIICNVVYKTQNKSTKHEFQVIINEEEKMIDCSCKKFEHLGILCCHCFRIFLDYEVNEIPESYMKQRWRKNIKFSKFTIGHHAWAARMDNTSSLVQAATKEFDQCINKVAENKELMDELIKQLKDLQVKYDEQTSSKVVECDTEKLVENFFGVRIPDQIDIEVPNVIRNKGCGSKSRIKSAKEKANINYMKVKRLCHGCKQLVNHDKRNFPLNPSRSKKEG